MNLSCHRLSRMSSERRLQTAALGAGVHARYGNERPAVYKHRMSTIAFIQMAVGYEPFIIGFCTCETLWKSDSTGAICRLLNIWSIGTRLDVNDYHYQHVDSRKPPPPQINVCNKFQDGVKSEALRYVLRRGCQKSNASRTSLAMPGPTDSRQPFSNFGMSGVRVRVSLRVCLDMIFGCTGHDQRRAKPDATLQAHETSLKCMTRSPLSGQARGGWCPIYGHVRPMLLIEDTRHQLPFGDCAVVQLHQGRWCSSERRKS